MRVGIGGNEESLLHRDFHLGLIHVVGSVTAGVAAVAIRNRLLSFGVGSSQCFAGTTDGERKVRSAVLTLGMKSQQCAIHGLHNALGALLKLNSRKNIRLPPPPVPGEPSEEEMDADDTSDGDDATNEDGTSDADGASVAQDDFDFSPEEELLDDDLSLSVKELIAKVRETFKDIKKSGPKRERLRALTALPSNNGKALNVILDVGIRWNSTISMIRRAVCIMPSLTTLLDEFRQDWLTASEKIRLTNILTVLEPFENAILCLSSSKDNLVHADRVFVALLERLKENNTDLSVALYDAVIPEIRKGRTSLSTVLQYLLNPAYDFHLENILGEPRISTETLVDLIVDVLDKDLENLNQTADEPEGNPPSSSSQQQWSFENVFTQPLRQTPQRSRLTASTLEVRLEINRHEAGQGLGKLLEMCLSKLLVIQPSSVQPERDFSTMNFICSKTRNSLSPEVLDGLVVLRSYLRTYES